MKNKILVCGCNGHMGEIVVSLIKNSNDMEVICGFDMIEDYLGSFPIYNNVQTLLNSNITPDIIIDFSMPDATTCILEFAKQKNVPIVIATTGFSDEQLENIKNISKEIPVFYSSNMSYQVNLVKHVLEIIAKAIPSAEVEITETHHNRKKDAPGGTAKTLANAIKEALEQNGSSYDIVYGREGKRKENEIGVCAKRGGNIVGTHTVEFFSPFETLEITHTAHSRELFADGAIKAARFIIEKTPGLYGMDDLVK